MEENIVDHKAPLRTIVIGKEKRTGYGGYLYRQDPGRDCGDLLQLRPAPTHLLEPFSLAIAEAREIRWCTPIRFISIKAKISAIICKVWQLDNKRGKT